MLDALKGRSLAIVSFADIKLALFDEFNRAFLPVYWIKGLIKIFFLPIDIQ